MQKPIKNRFIWIARSFSHRITLLIGSRYGNCFPMYFVCGFPRSGTSWISEILSDYLGLPRPKEYLLPLAFPCIVHTHAEHYWSLPSCLYVVRDGRDCLVSSYFRMVKRVQAGDGILEHQYKRIFGVHADILDVDSNFPIFVDYALNNPRGTKSHWGSHVGGWVERSKKDNNVVVVKYEDVLKQGVFCLYYSLKELIGSVDQHSLEEAFKRHDFEAVKKFGENRAGTNFRKGVPGDWRNWFDKKSAEIFQEKCGDTLIKMGYEKDSSWIKQF